jgi:NADH:ubiquinone oxidoreductase subunit 3 (subunit A)
MVFIDAFDSDDDIFVVLLLTFILCTVLAAVVVIAASGDSAENEHIGEYECGFEPFDDGAKSPFDVQFFIIGLLFLIFDVEVSLLIPYILELGESSTIGFFSCLIFVGILTYGFAYE